MYNIRFSLPGQSVLYHLLISDHAHLIIPSRETITYHSDDITPTIIFNLS